MNTGVKLEPIAALLKRQFFIRSYQRGYRWDEDQVNDLLNDFSGFIGQENKHEDEFYCLQPVVVRKIPSQERVSLKRFEFSDEPVYEVIDGQQRITTIVILLHYLLNELAGDVRLTLPAITYEVRPESKKILTAFNDYMSIEEKQQELEDDIDFYHMKIVYDTVVRWFDGKAHKHMSFLKLLTSYKINNVRVIWYEVEESENSIEVFRRFNVGKIPLSNAELIKALLLKDNTDVSTSLIFSVAKEWQMIENQLQDPYFWGFLNPQKTYTSRIEYLFDLLFRKERAKNHNHHRQEFDQKFGTDKSSVFRFFQEKISKAGNDLQPVWDEIVLVFEQIGQWYNHSEHYHYIGYLQNYERPKETNDVVFDIIMLSGEDEGKGFATKSDLTDYLIGKIKAASGSWFKNKKIKLTYIPADLQKLRNLFFLFNVETCIKISVSGDGEETYRLPFKLNKDNDYDIEHIDSKTEKEISEMTEKERIQYLKDLYLDFENELHTKMQELHPEAFVEGKFSQHWLEENMIPGMPKLNMILQEALEELDKKLAGEGDQLLDKNSIGNLTALNSSINRSYGNSFYKTKRRRIIEEDQAGTYIPITSKNIFLKYYSRYPQKNSRWNASDAGEYTKELENCLSKFMQDENL
ncbi:DUF262 domain-containing protein [Chryseobacterium vrystaatense]|uniref:Uncharacterized conserved protein, contains ParB-like and HNH nuclease domains n=1 Tax=Chryseobacterium vrystaatense TaxID=307480 RepID=A0A1M5I9Q8_9FLAO|nr:DUF262 domain-containing protein [Chryseobacterium vrystaatense]SHG24859.1 Uncharacterized conserved protein, contains ParB-like and HNH nuclease domains [Chryseobacterium vrystaatense]